VKEVNLEEAASLLGKSEKTIRVYINKKKIAATKVGGKWFLDLASILRLKSDLEVQLGNSAVQLGNSAVQLGNSEVQLGNSEVQLGNSEVQLGKPNNLALGKSASGISSLAAYRQALKSLSLPMWQSLDEHAWLGEELEKLRIQILSSLGSGYYSFGRNKINFYNDARAGAGAILALCHSDPKYNQAWSHDLKNLEHEFLGAVTALVKRMEKPKTK